MNTLQLDEKIEKVVKKTVKYYYSDWKNYDRPKYMKLKGIKPEHITLIVRACGTYIFNADDIQPGTTAAVIVDYFTNQEPANIYDIELKKNKLTLIHKGIA